MVRSDRNGNGLIFNKRKSVLGGDHGHVEQNNNIITIKIIGGLKLKKISRFKNKKLSIFLLGDVLESQKEVSQLVCGEQVN